MLAVLFGSYSIVLTVAGIPSFLLLKSMILYFLLLPPPLMSYSDLTLIVTSSVLLKGSNEGFLWFCSCNLREVGTSHMSS